MPKPTIMHELLAAHGNHETQWEGRMKELHGTFVGKQQHFVARETQVEPFNEEDVKYISDKEDQVTMQTTVLEELNWVSQFFTKAVDCSFQIDLANQTAKADIILEDGTVLVPDVPATALLELEKRLGRVNELFSAIPTLDPAKGFELDPSHEKKGVYKSREMDRIRTKKVNKVIKMTEATDRHPATSQLVSEDIPFAKLRTIEWSSMLTPQKKSELMGRIDELTRAVKKARSRANSVEVDTSKKIGRTLFAFILGDAEKVA